MDRIQANQVAMLRTVKGHVAKHPEVAAAIPILGTLGAELVARIEKIDEAAAKAGTTVGITVNKETARRNAIEFAVPIAAALKAYAKKVGDAALVAKVDYSKSDFAGLREEDYLPVVKGIATEAQGLIAEIGQRGILPAHVASLVEWNTKYRDMMAAPRTTATEISEALTILDAEISGAMKLLRDEMDPTAEAARLTFPNFTSGYKSARVIIDRPGTQGGGTPDPATP